MVSHRLIVWIAILMYIALLSYAWIDYFAKLTGLITLENALLFTVIAPALTWTSFKIRQIRSLRFWRLTWIALGASVFGFIIFGVLSLILNRILIIQAWMAMDGTVRMLLIMSFSYPFGAFLGDQLGKRVEYKPTLLN